MSLVAYNSSGESGHSDSEDDTPTNNTPKSKRTTQIKAADNISDEEDNFTNVNTNVSAPTNDSLDTNSVDQVGGLLKGLPAPRPGGQSNCEDETELEAEVLAKPTQVTDAPKPKVAKQTVKITIPKLTKDSEDEADIKKDKQQTRNTGLGKTGLFALLPEPINVTKKATNRMLIPHTLTKRQQDKKAVKSKSSTPGDLHNNNDSDGFSKRYTAFSGLTGYGSDSDDDGSTPVNFFLIDSAKTFSQTETIKSSLNVAPSLDEDSSVPVDIVDDADVNDVVVADVAPPVSGKMVETLTGDLPAVVAHVTAEETSPEETLPSNMPSGDQDAPLSFKATNATQQNLLSAASMGTRYHYYQSAHSSHQETPPAQEEDEEINKYLQDEQFLRLQGKRKRGKEEINIIDCNMADFVNHVDSTKNITEESSYQSHAKDLNPTHQQRRKKQITYLAFQAKEREIELKNSWAANRMTKRQTQAKYGF